MSRLLDKSVTFREQNVVRNTYNENDKYEVGHPNALSDGDELGKGLLNNEVGSATDIKLRETSFARNIFNKNREYNAGTA